MNGNTLANELLLLGIDSEPVRDQEFDEGLKRLRDEDIDVPGRPYVTMKYHRDSPDDDARNPALPHQLR